MTEAELSRMRTTVAILNSLPRPDALALLDEVYRLRGLIDRALAAGHCYPSAGSDPGEVLVFHCECTHRDLLDRAAEIDYLVNVCADTLPVVETAIRAGLDDFSRAEEDEIVAGHATVKALRAALAPPADES